MCVCVWVLFLCLQLATTTFKILSNMQVFGSFFNSNVFRVIHFSTLLPFYCICLFFFFFFNSFLPDCRLDLFPILFIELTTSHCFWLFIQKFYFICFCFCFICLFDFLIEFAYLVFSFHIIIIYIHMYIYRLQMDQKHIFCVNQFLVGWQCEWCIFLFFVIFIFISFSFIECGVVRIFIDFNSSNFKDMANVSIANEIKKKSHIR